MPRKNVFSLQLNMRFTQTCNQWKFAMLKKLILSQLLKLWRPGDGGTWK